MSTRITLSCTAILLTFSVSLFAKPVPDNLGNGLDRIVTNKLIQEGKITSAPSATQTTAPTRKVGKSSGTKQATVTTTSTADFASYKDLIAKQAASYQTRAITETATGKYLVEIMPNGRVPVATLQSTLQTKYPLVSVTGTNTSYAGHGVIEGYVALDDVAGIANTQGVGSVILQLRPVHSSGSVTAQGVNQHRVNHINSFYNSGITTAWDGTGMQIGVMSDSYNSQPSEEGGFTTADQDVASDDLPGTANTVPPPAGSGNTQPVVVLQDFSNPPNAT